MAIFFNKTILNTCLLLIVFLSTVHIIVAKLATTSFYKGDERIILIYKNQKPELYQRPIWGKYPYKIIDLPFEWFQLRADKDVHYFESTLTTRVNKQIATLLLKFNFLNLNKLSINELDDLISRQDPNKKNAIHFDFIDCIEHIFKTNFKQNDGPTQIEAIISEWTASNQNRDELIKKVKEKLTFPTALFDKTVVIIDLLEIKLQMACILDD